MLRIQNLFAVASLLFLSPGLLASQIASTGFTFQIGQRRGFGLSLEVPFYCIATLFGAFAFLYSIGYIPFNPMMARWHFWLSLVGVVLCVTGAAIFWFGAEHAKEPWTWGVNLIAFSWITGILIFPASAVVVRFRPDPSCFDDA
jgi:hypothetical protein